MKKTLLLSFAILASATATQAKVGTTATQEGYSLTNEWSCEAMGKIVAGSGTRGGAGANDKFFVMKQGSKDLQVYDQNGLVNTITCPYFLWSSATTDEAGNILVRCDKNKTTFDGIPSTGGNSGFIVVDSKTAEIVKDFVPMTQASGKRFDALAPVKGDILTGKDVRIMTPVQNTEFAYVYSYDQAAVTVAVRGTYTFATPINKELFTASEVQVQTSTGVAMAYDEDKHVAALVNHQFEWTYSAAGKFGNSIANYTTVTKTISDSQGNVKAYIEPSTEVPVQYFFTPQHSGMTGFNIFTLQDKQYIIYPGGGKSMAPDAFAISEVSFVDTPLTDMEAPEETKVTGKLVARAYAAMNAAGTAAMYTTQAYCTPTYHIEAVEGDPNSVYIYAYGSGAQGNKWKFTVPENTSTGIENIEDDVITDAEGDVNAAPVYYNLQGVRVAEPTKGIFIEVRGNKSRKVAF